MDAYNQIPQLNGHRVSLMMHTNQVVYVYDYACIHAWGYNELSTVRIYSACHAFMWMHAYHAYYYIIACTYLHAVDNTNDCTEQRWPAHAKEQCEYC